MLSTKAKRNSRTTGLAVTGRSAEVESIWTKETLREDAAAIVKLFQEGKLSQGDMELMLSLVLSGYILSKTYAMASELENAFAEMFIEQLAADK